MYKSILLILLFLYSCQNEIKYDEAFVIYLNKYKIGYMIKNKEEYSQKLYFYYKNKKIIKNITMKKKDSFYTYIKGEKILKINTKKQIYPFLFNKLKINDLIYFPKLNKEIPIQKLLKFNKNSFTALPLKYKKVRKLPDTFDKIDISLLQKIKTQKIKTQYPIRIKIKLYSDFLPPSNYNQECYKEKKYIICELKPKMYENKINFKEEKIKFKNDRLSLFIKKNKLHKSKILIANIIDSINKNITYKDISSNLNSEEIIKRGYGDCSEMSLLARDILRALDIKSYRVYGLIYRNSKFSYHTWTRYYYNNQKFDFDVSFKKIFINSNYLELAQENEYGVVNIPIIEKIDILSYK